MPHLAVLVCATGLAFSPPVAVAGLSGSPASARPAITTGQVVMTAWDNLQAAEATIEKYLAAGRITEVPAQAEIIKSAVAAIGRGVQITDESNLKRFNSAAREIIALADRLSAVAAAGNYGCAGVVHANLHRYVDFIQTHLQRSTASPSNPSP